MSTLPQLAKVWPLVPGLQGCNALGKPITLQPGQAGWMQVDEARAAEKADQVDVMAGKTPQSLRTPQYQTPQSLRTPQYQTRVAAVEAPPPPPPAPAPPTPPGSELAPPPVVEEEPAPTPTPKRAPPKKRNYRRRDTQAENP